MPLKSYVRLRTSAIRLLIVIGLVLLATLTFSYQQQLQQARRHLEPVSTQAAKLIQRQLQEISSGLNILADAGRRYFSGKATLTELDTRIYNLNQIVSSVGNFALLDADGFVVSTNLDSIYMQNLAYREYFTGTRDALNPTSLVLSAPFTAMTGNRIFTLSRAIQDDSGAFAGVIVASVDTSLLRSMIELQLEEEEGTLQFIIAHGNGTPIFSVPENLIDDRNSLNQPGSPVAAHLLSNRQQSTLTGRISTSAPKALIDIRTVRPQLQSLSDSLLVLTLTEKQVAMRDWQRLALLLSLLFGVIVASVLLLLRHEKRHLLKEHQISRELSRQTRRLSAIIEGTNVGTWEWNVQTGKTIFNERWAEMIGCRLAELAPTTIGTLTEFIHPDDKTLAQERLQQHFRGETPYYECEMRMRHRDNHWVWVLNRGKVATWTPDGKPEWMFGTHQEITERKQAERRTTQLAFFDSLTELPNRRLLDQRLDAALPLAHRNKRILALLFLDLDGFKQINDTLGHNVGDLLLRKVAYRLRSCVRDSDTVARNGGDEFVIMLPEITSSTDACRVAEKVLRRLTRPASLDGHNITVSASIGIAIYPGDGLDRVTLMDHADQAMYIAKRAGRNCYRQYQPLQTTTPE